MKPRAMQREIGESGTRITGLHVPQDRGMCRVVMLAGVILLTTACSVGSSMATQMASSSTAVAPPTASPAVTATPRVLPAATATRPTPSLTPSFSPTLTPTPATRPDLRWDVPVHRLVATDVQAAGWVDDSRVRIERRDGIVEWLSTNGEILPTPTAEPGIIAGRSGSVSPDRRHLVTYVDGQVILYQAGQEQPVATTDLTLELGLDSIDWAPDSQSTIIVAEDALYLWAIDGTEPVRLTDTWTYQFAWSPDHTRLAYLTFDGTLFIRSADGSVVTVPGLWLGMMNGIPEWHGPNLISVFSSGAWAGMTYFINATTGEAYPSWFNDFGMSLSPSFSPDWTWRITDNVERRWRGEPYASADYMAHHYEVVNQVTGKIYDLLPGTISPSLDWVGWSEDGSRFYLVNRALGERDTADADLPFGLLALDPATGTTDMLFEQAIFARLTADRRKAWVLFPARHDSRLGVDGAVFDLETGAVTARTPVLDNMIYRAPSDRGYLPAAWSADGAWLVWADGQGALTLLDAQTGALTPLTHDSRILHHPLETLAYQWSPDNRHLLVQAEQQVWIVDVSAIIGRSRVVP